MSMTGKGMATAVFDGLFNAGKFGDMTRDDVLSNGILDDMEITYNAVVKYIQDNAVVNVTVKAGEDATSRATSMLSKGVPIAGDGGAGLKASAILASPATLEHSIGDPTKGTGGID